MLQILGLLAWWLFQSIFQSINRFRLSLVVFNIY